MPLQALQIPATFPARSAVVRVAWEAGQLSVVVRGASEGGGSTAIDFPDVVGFRVLDERDLMEYWPACSSPDGGLFEIQQGGWLEQEQARPGSCIGPMKLPRHEFLVVGCDNCVSVLTSSQPRVHQCEV